MMICKNQGQNNKMDLLQSRIRFKPLPYLSHPTKRPVKPLHQTKLILGENIYRFKYLQNNGRSDRETWNGFFIR